MSFTADWLTLREPADAAARAPALLTAAAAHLRRAPTPVVVDLGAGTGATLRAFAGLAPPDTRWRLIDRDAELLGVAASRSPHAETFRADLADLDRLPLAGARLVTASALLDLMPYCWIEALADRLAAAGIGFYAALSYDGCLDWHPPMPDDAAVRDAFNAHQRGDKGLGPALGPGAAAATAEAFERRGFAVQTAESPWRLGPAQAALQRELVTGIAAAAVAAGLGAAAVWGQARRAASGVSICSVGHLDVLALPAGASAQSKITSVSRP